MSTDIPSFVAGIRKLAAVLDMDYDELRNDYQHVPGFPAKTRKGWPVAACSEFIQARKTEKAAQIKGPHADVRRNKLEIECEILQAKLQQLRGELMPLAEHHAEIQTITTLFLSGIEEWVQWLAVEFRDPAVLKKGKDIRERLKAWLTKEVTA